MITNSDHISFATLCEIFGWTINVTVDGYNLMRGEKVVMTRPNFNVLVADVIATHVVDVTYR